MNIIQISCRESEVIGIVKKHDLTVFGPSDLQQFMGISRESAYKVLTNMRKRDLVRRIERGKYILNPISEEMEIHVCRLPW